MRGVYAKHELKAGQELTPEDIYLAIPLLKGQLSCRELMQGEMMMQNCASHAAVMIDMIDGPHARNPGLRDLIYKRGLDPSPDTVSLLAMAEAVRETVREQPAECEKVSE